VCDSNGCVCVIEYTIHAAAPGYAREREREKSGVCVLGKHAAITVTPRHERKREKRDRETE